MKHRIALAYSGSPASTAAIGWLREQHRGEVVTVTLDLGQADDLDEVRARALDAGAVRAHVIDARDIFARDYVIPALQQAAREDAALPIAQLAEPLIARTLVELAAIESADAVAHASRGFSLDHRIAEVDPTRRVVAVARATALPAAAQRRLQHLLLGRAVDPAHLDDAEAHVEIAFEGGLPVSLNGITMTLQELIDSLSLLGGQYGIGHGDVLSAPAAVVLRAAYAALPGGDGSVRIRLHKGTFEVSVPVNNL